MRPAEAGQIIGPSLGPVGAGGSDATPEVLVEDRWMGGGGSAAMPKVLMEGGLRCRAPRADGGGRICRHTRGIDREGWLRRHALRDNGGEPPPHLGAGGRLKTVLSRRVGAGNSGFIPKTSLPPDSVGVSHRFLCFFFPIFLFFGVTLRLLPLADSCDRAVLWRRRPRRVSLFRRE